MTSRLKGNASTTPTDSAVGTIDIAREAMMAMTPNIVTAITRIITTTCTPVTPRCSLTGMCRSSPAAGTSARSVGTEFTLRA